MGGQYPPLDREQVESILKKLEFYIKRQNSSSHAQWEGFVKGKRRIVTVDSLKSKKEKFAAFILKKMIEQSGLSKNEFYSYLD
jgi:predicted RNA binding protein YcfA (HicA-like mRNA interferase family)